MSNLTDDVFKCAPRGRGEILCTTEDSLYRVNTTNRTVNRIKSSLFCNCNSQNHDLSDFCLSGISDFMILPNRAILVAHSLENCIRYIDTVEQTVSIHFGECKLSSCNRKECSNVGDFTKVRLDRPHSFAEGKNGVYYLSVMSAVLKVNEKKQYSVPFYIDESIPPLQYGRTE